MNTKLVNSAAGVIHAALTQNRTPAGIALALDSAQLLLTPEKVAEVERLTARVAELEATVRAMAAVDAVKATNRSMRATADRLPRREDGERVPFTHHDYRVSHDLPSTGGA